MSMFHTEGYIKMVTQSEGEKSVSFKIEASAPYFFEIKEDDKSPSEKRKILFVSESEDSARIVSHNHTFKMTNTDFTALLIAKANHMNLRVSIDLGDGKLIDDPCEIKTIEFR